MLHSGLVKTERIIGLQNGLMTTGRLATKKDSNKQTCEHIYIQKDNKDISDIINRDHLHQSLTGVYIK